MILLRKSRNKKQIFKMQIIHYLTKNISIKRSNVIHHRLLSKDIHFRKTQRTSHCCMEAIPSDHTLSATFSTSDASYLSVLSSTRLQDWQWFNIILIVSKYIPQTGNIVFNSWIECTVWNSQRIFPLNKRWDYATHSNCLMQQ